MRVLTLLTCLVVAGCHGPLPKPMVDRLDEDMQAAIDEQWSTMLTPPGQVDRTLLLDAILVGQLHQHGVDSVRFISEKKLGDELVVMQVHFDRDDPEMDEFVFTYVDIDGYEIRRESYSREDVEERAEFLFGPMVAYGPSAALDEQPTRSREEGERHEQERQARLEEIWALRAPRQEDGTSATDAEWQNDAEK